MSANPEGRTHWTMRLLWRVTDPEFGDRCIALIAAFAAGAVFAIAMMGGF